MQRIVSAVLMALLALASSSLAQAPQSGSDRTGIEHVLLISIDGMHAVDFLNCSQGIAGVNDLSLIHI